MHIYKLEEWQHHHQFNMENPQGERNTWKVISLTLVMMVIEIIAGLLFGSMALLADGFHMATHTFALGITAIAYYYSRKHAHDRRYSFGHLRLVANQLCDCLAEQKTMAQAQAPEILLIEALLKDLEWYFQVCVIGFCQVTKQGTNCD